MKHSQYYGGSKKEVDDARLCQAARAQCDLYGFTIRREKRGKEIVCVIIPNRPAVQAAQS